MYQNIIKKPGLALGLLLSGMAVQAQTVDLNSRVSNPNSPATADVVWYTTPDRSGTPLTPAQAAAVLPTSTATNYYAFFTTGADCWSDGAKVTLIDAPCTTQTVDLTLLTGAPPSGGSQVVVVWYKDKNRTELVVNPTSVGKGTYYAFYESIADPANCFSPASSPVIVEGNCALPVSLLSFTAQKQGAAALLDWTTAQEQNNKGFEVQRSSNSNNWTKIGFTASLAQGGSSNALLNYTFTDSKPLTGKSFYRLKQMDNDGKWTYSDVRSLQFDGAVVTIHPNPAKESVMVDNLSGQETMVVYDAMGRLLQELSAAGSTTVSIDLRSFTPGVYSIRVSNGEGAATVHKLVKY